MIEQEKFILLTILPKTNQDKKEEEAGGCRSSFTNKTPVRWLIKICTIESVVECMVEDEVSQPKIWRRPKAKPTCAKIALRDGSFVRVKETMDEILGMIQGMNICPNIVINAREP